MIRSSSIDLVVPALVALGEKMTNPAMNGINPHFRSKYVKLDDLIDHCREVLAAHELAIVQTVDEIDGRPSMTTLVMHKSGQYIGSTMPLVLSKSDMQGMGSAITYARRYMISALLNVQGDEDDDANAVSSEPSSDPFDL